MQPLSALPRDVARATRAVLTDIDDTLTTDGRLPAVAYTAMERLRAAGYAADDIDAMTYDSYESNVDTAHRIAREVANLRARTGATRVDVVSHSMGAISSRYWMDHLGGAAEVDTWGSLAGVNEGTVWAYGCYVLAPCREMVPTSSVIGGLAHASRTSGGTRSSAARRPT